MGDTEVTFRDFAGAVMANDTDKAARVLEALLGVDAAAGAAAAAHFQGKVDSEGQAFMMKAMGLRHAVTAGSDEDTQKLLGECFGLSGAASVSAAESLRARYR